MGRKYPNREKLRLYFCLPMPTQNKLEALRKREAEIRAKIAEEETKRRKREEKDETRLKLLVGSAVLADVEKTPETKAAVVAVIDRGIGNPKDREFLKAKGWLSTEGG
jgi:hypothetical protein